MDLLGDPLPEKALARLGTRRFRNANAVTELALNAAEDVVVTFDGGTVIVWDAQTGKQHRQIPHSVRFSSTISAGAAAYGVRALVFAPDGRRFYTWGEAGTLVVWDSATGGNDTLRISDAPPDLSEPFRSLDVSRDGLLALGNSKALLICQADGRVIHAVPNAIESPLQYDGNDRLMFGGDFSYGRFAPDGRSVAVVNSAAPQAIRVVDVETGKDLLRIDTSARVVRIDFAPDGRRIVATERDVATRMYDTATGARLWEHVIKPELNAESYTSAVAISPDGALVAVGAPVGPDNRIRLLNAGTGTEVGALTGHEWKPWTLAFTADSRGLYSSGWNGEILRWDVPERRQVPLPEGVRATGVCAASPRGGRLAYAGQDGVIRLASASDGSMERSMQLGEIECGQIAFSPDGRLLAGGGQGAEQMELAVWDVETGAVRHHWQWPVGRDPHSSVEALSFSPDGRRVAVASFRQDQARVYDLASDRLLAQFDHRRIYGLSFGPQGEELATAGWDSIVRLWDISSGKLNRSRRTGDLMQGDNRMYGVRISPDGRTLATANMFSSVWVWNLDDLSLRHALPMEGRFTSGPIDFSPGGQWLAVGAGDQVTLWDPYSGQQVWTGGQHANTVYTVDFGRDERTLLTGGRDGVCYLWDLAPNERPPPREPTELFRDLVGGDGAAAYRAKWSLADDPQAAVQFLASKLQAASKSVDADLVHRLITALDADEFRERESAQQELTRVGVAATDQVRQALEASKSVEQKSRLQEVLAALESEAARDGITVHRALSVLEQISSPEAVAVVEMIARDHAGSAMGRIASETLARLK